MKFEFYTVNVRGNYSEDRDGNRYAVVYVKHEEKYRDLRPAYGDLVKFERIGDEENGVSFPKDKKIS